MKKERIKAGLYGMLIGDALGVPYEFHSRSIIDKVDHIDFEPPDWFRRAHEGVPPGTWSDDGAQALCLFASITECQGFSLIDFSDKLLRWLDQGYMALDNNVFDVGSQTYQALMAYKDGVSPEKSGFVVPEGKGNGSLMRVLPIALLSDGDYGKMIFNAHSQSLVTHGHITNQVCCALYCTMAHEIIKGCTVDQLMKNAIQRLDKYYETYPIYKKALKEVIVALDSADASGSGYVIDTLKGVEAALMASTYENVITYAIRLGNDTDTTAAIAGGLAGLRFGYDHIPKEYIRKLRGQYIVDRLLREYNTD